MLRITDQTLLNSQVQDTTAKACRLVPNVHRIDRDQKETGSEWSVWRPRRIDNLGGSVFGQCEGYGKNESHEPSTGSEGTKYSYGEEMRESTCLGLVRDLSLICLDPPT